MIAAHRKPQYAGQSLQRRATFHPTAPEVVSEVCDELVHSTITDIFDAPARLGGSAPRSGIDDTLQRTVISYPRVSPPLSLPSPITFDGPTRPRCASASRDCRSQVQPSSNRSSISPRVSSSIPEHPLPEIFDGPSRIRPHSFHPLGSAKVAILQLTAVIFVPAHVY